MLGGCPTSEASSIRPTSHKDSRTSLLPALRKTVMHKHDVSKTFCLPHWHVELARRGSFQRGLMFSVLTKSAVRRIEGHLSVTPSPACGSSITDAHNRNFQCNIPSLQQGAYKKTKNARNKQTKNNRKKKYWRHVLREWMSLNLALGEQLVVYDTWPHLRHKRGKMEGCLTVNGENRTETQDGGRGPMGSRQAGRLDGLVGWVLVSV